MLATPPIAPLLANDSQLASVVFPILLIIMAPGIFLNVGLIIGVFAGDTGFERAAIRKAQEAWVLAHGLLLPKDSFDNLHFPQSVPNMSRIFGTANLLEPDKDGRLITAVLSYESGEDYVLRGTNGAILKPLELVAA